MHINDIAMLSHFAIQNKVVFPNLTGSNECHELLSNQRSRHIREITLFLSGNPFFQN